MQNKYYKCGVALQVLSVGQGKGQFLLDRRLMDHHPLAHSGELQYYAVQHKLRSHCRLLELSFWFRNERHGIVVPPPKGLLHNHCCFCVGCVVIFLCSRWWGGIRCHQVGGACIAWVSQQGPIISRVVVCLQLIAQWGCVEDMAIMGATRPAGNNTFTFATYKT